MRKERHLSLFEQIRQAYDEISIADKEPLLGWNNSVALSMLQTDIAVINKEFPKYKVSHIYLGYYLVCFLKPLMWGYEQEKGKELIKNWKKR